MVDYTQYVLDRQIELVKFQMQEWLNRGMTLDQLKNITPLEPVEIFEEALKNFTNG